MTLSRSQPVTIEGKSECSLACHHGGGGIAGITGAGSNRMVTLTVLGAGGPPGVAAGLLLLPTTPLSLKRRSWGAGTGVHIRQIDLADRTRTIEFAHQIREEFTFDALVNNAGILEKQPLEGMTLDSWDRTLQVNVTAPTHPCPGDRPRMFPGGSIVNIARGVKVNAVTPGWVESGILSESYEAAALTPLGRKGRPEDISKVVAFLLSSEAAFINGASIVADGGYTGVDYYMKQEDQSSADPSMER